MTPGFFGVFVLASFLVPVPIIAWLDRPKGVRGSLRMYAGHFAAGLALKAHEPRAPTWGILIGVGFLDLLFGPLLLLGIERASMTPGVGPGFSLDFIDWSHSLVTSVVWAALFALLFYRWGGRVMAVMAAAVFSHFLLDLPMHPPDLALWPGADHHVGLGLWHRLPTGWWIVELGVIALGGGYYWMKARESTTFGRHAMAAVLIVLVLHVFNAPWLSPM